jgi:hypothetical protein
MVLFDTNVNQQDVVVPTCLNIFLECSSLDKYRMTNTLVSQYLFIDKKILGFDCCAAHSVSFHYNSSPLMQQKHETRLLCIQRRRYVVLQHPI